MITVFIIGSLYSLLIISIGVVIGFYVGNRTIEQKIERIRAKLSPYKTDQPQVRSGPVKTITKRELEEEKEAGFKQRLQELVK